jgi:hypothetical protein
MSTALNIFVNILTPVATLFALAMIRICFTEIVNKTTRYSFIIVLCLQVLQQICSVVTYQVKYLHPIESLTFMIMLLSCFGQIYVVVGILRIFSILDDRITPARLYKLHVSIYLLYTLLTIPSVIYTITAFAGKPFDFTKSVAGYELIGSAQAVLTAIIEQLTSVRITILIIRNARSMQSHKQLVRTIILLISQAILDYLIFGIQGFQIASYDGHGNSYADIPNDFGDRYQLVLALITIHFSLSVFTFIQYKRLFVEGKNDEAGKSKGSKSSDDPKSAPVVMLLDAVKKGNARRHDDSSPVRTEIIPKTVIIRD